MKCKCLIIHNIIEIFKVKTIEKYEDENHNIGIVSADLMCFMLQTEFSFVSLVPRTIFEL